MVGIGVAGREAWSTGGALLILSVLAWPVGAAGQDSQAQPCIDCHLEQEEERLSLPARTFVNDVHGSLGLGCLSCHGRLPSDRMAPAAGFLAKPERTQIPGMCGSCHSNAEVMAGYNPTLPRDQESEYLTSAHGRLLMEVGDLDVATCVDCHAPHDMREPSDPESPVHPLNVADLCGSCHADRELMEPRGHAWDEVDEYRAGVHGVLLHEEGDLSAPTCNDCHGNHGAAPPGFSSIHAVCGECHAVMDELFSGSGHDQYFSEAGLGGCTVCHENHDIRAATDELLTEAERNVCRSCHEEDEGVGDDFERMAQHLDSLELAAAEARSALDEAENMGMEVSEAIFDLEEVNNALTLARGSVHSFQASTVLEEVATGIVTTDTAMARADRAFQEHRYRRVGLAVSAGIILLLVVGLLMRIKELDRRLGRPDPTNGQMP